MEREEQVKRIAEYWKHRARVARPTEDETPCELVLESRARWLRGEKQRRKRGEIGMGSSLANVDRQWAGLELAIEQAEKACAGVHPARRPAKSLRAYTVQHLTEAASIAEELARKLRQGAHFAAQFHDPMNEDYHAASALKILEALEAVRKLTTEEE